ncbi:MAG: PAAR domain-containing protein [bacterium]|nr:PAAR domain-containing protein [bacterium]
MAARMGDPHLCPMVDGVKPHVGGPIVMGCPTVMIGGQPAARVGDAVTCAGPPDMISMGSRTVTIGFMMAARFMDPTAHGGMISMGCPNVIIGDG